MPAARLVASSEGSRRAVSDVPSTADDQVHAQVVRPVHGVHVQQQVNDLAGRALRRGERVRLVPPQRRAAEPVTADRQGGERGDDHRQPAGQLPRGRARRRRSARRPGG